MHGIKELSVCTGAIARWVDADGNDVFYKLVEIVGGKAKWITLIDTKYGNVTLQSTYDKNYEIVNIVPLCVKLGLTYAYQLSPYVNV